MTSVISIVLSPSFALDLQRELLRILASIILRVVVVRIVVHQLVSHLLLNELFHCLF
jgi:hypothetical protein